MNQNDASHPMRLLRLKATAVLLCLLITAAALVCTQCRTESDSGQTSGVLDKTDVPSDTPPTEEAAAVYDPLSFDTPEIPDDGSQGHLAADDSGVYIYRSTSFELCGASDEAGKDYAAAVSELKESAPEFTVYNMVIPTHIEFGLPPRLSEETYTVSQSQNIRTIYSSYTQDVQPINCYNALCSHMSEYIYFNTDHHWTGLGAYYAYQAFCEQTGQTPLLLSDCTEKQIEGFEGSFYSSDPDLSGNTDTVHYWTFPYQTHALRLDESSSEPEETNIYYEYVEPGSNVYGLFICGDAPLFIEYNDENQNGRKIAVVKESFGNAFVPYLSYNYEEVHVIDSRYFEDNLKDYMEENGITEVLFLNNIMSANNPFQVDGIRDLS